jgi:hypothetical protein
LVFCLLTDLFFAPGNQKEFIMALVKFGGGITAMSGSIAGNVFARNRFGSYVRSRTKPVNPHSSRQEAIRSIVSYLSEYWHVELDDDARNLWNVYAAAVLMKNKLGESINISGFNHFIRSNSLELLMSESVIDAAPSVLSLPDKDPLLLCSAEAIAAQTFTFTCDTEGWAPNGDPKFGIIIHQGQPQLASRNFFNGPWRYMDYIDSTEGAAGTGTLSASFAFAEGQKVWFQARIITDGGRVSEPWQIEPREIEADA